jgi:hypothetical protein
MKLCGHCHRHILDAARSCPFCARRVQSVSATATWMLGVALGLSSASCASDDAGDTGNSSMTAPDTTEGRNSQTDSESMSSESMSSTTLDPDSSTTDMGGSYYAGPSGSSTTWEESSSSSGSSDSGSSTASESSEDSTDAGGSYYAGPSSSTGIWAEEPEKPA